MLESAGLRFDCLWVSGLTDEAWPLDARAQSLPADRRAEEGRHPAGERRDLRRARPRITEGWKRAAAEVVFSWPLKDEDRDFAPSPLITRCRPREGGDPVCIPITRATATCCSLPESWKPSRTRKAPPVTPGKVRGGTRVLADQAACPFRAFAKWRLGAEELEEPEAGLDARDRGTLMHALMREIWTRLRGSSFSEQRPRPAITQSAAAAVKEMGLEGRFAELERERLAKLAREWLEVERAARRSRLSPWRRSARSRSPAWSSSRASTAWTSSPTAATCSSTTRARKHAQRRSSGTAPRPDDPQLPLYAVAAPEDLAAVAFAKVAPGRHALHRLLAQPSGAAAEGRRATENWQQLLAAWKRDAEALGAAFAAGEAQVDPKERLEDLPALRPADPVPRLRENQSVAGKRGRRLEVAICDLKLRQPVDSTRQKWSQIATTFHTDD